MKRRDFLRYGALGLVAAAVPGLCDSPANIVRCVIHPAIGIARVGNSPDQFFIGPETPGQHPTPDGGFKDAAGRMKRQAARFRVFGLDADGKVVKELTAANAQITWTVHLANSKAAWYAFDMPFDIPEATGQPPAEGASASAPLVSPRRNEHIRGVDRGRLVIDPGPRSIGGANVNPIGTEARYAFDNGRFFDRTVPLGDLRTDEAGRLLVLGGSGVSGPARGPGTATFTGEDGWQDDVSDGPVEATVRIGDHVLEATGAWVVVAPPNYAPGISSIVTMYDLVFEVATRLEPDRAPPRPSFTRQIFPLFERHVRNQWVNAGFARGFGWGAAEDFLAPALLGRLADPSPVNADLRRGLFQRFRDPAYPRMQPNALPPYYGDNTQLQAETPRQWMAVLPNQYGWLRQWAEGDFDADWPPDGLRFPSRLEDLPLAERPAALDRAALDECLGGPFHPGCELTWPMRITSLYTAPFRLRRRGGVEPDWGNAMTSNIALAPSGPLSASGAGDLTRWMAVPWQVDTASCLSAYQPDDEYLPGFWPARVPNDVLTAAAYATVLDAAAGAQRRQDAFRARPKWLRPLPLDGFSAETRVNAFLREWTRFGIITRRPGPSNDPAFPPEPRVSDRGRHVDVAIVGGGPAGAATALALARAGLRAVVLERGTPSSDKAGESLAPSVTPLLHRLGLFDAFLTTNPLPCHGNRSAWGGDGRLTMHDFINNPHGNGWHIDRRRFEVMLLDTARAAGASIRLGCNTVDFQHAGGCWRLTAGATQDADPFTAAVLVDASGRAGVAARRLGARRRHEDRLVGVTAFLEPGSAVAEDSTTLVEATRDGWWYSALVPDGRLAIVYFTDPDLLTERRAWTASGWSASLLGTTHMRARVEQWSYWAPRPPRVVAAGSACLDYMAGDGWLAVGDAAASYDPLSSHGIATALAGGLHAAAAIRAHLGGVDGALISYADRVAGAYARYLGLRAVYYRDERRWPEAPFWQRRHR